MNAVEQPGVMLSALAHITNVSHRIYHLLIDKVAMTTQGITSFWH